MVESTSSKIPATLLVLWFVSLSVFAQEKGSWSDDIGEPNNPRSEDPDGGQTIWQDCMQRRSTLWYILHPVKGVLCEIIDAIEAIFKLALRVFLNWILKTAFTMIESFFTMISNMILG